MFQVAHVMSSVRQLSIAGLFEIFADFFQNILYKWVVFVLLLLLCIVYFGMAKYINRHLRGVSRVHFIHTMS